MKRYFLWLAGCMIMGQLSAQSPGLTAASDATLSAPTGPIITDRPDQTESPFLVPQWHVQVEAGVQQGAAGRTREVDLPTLLARIGITEYAELRLGGTNTLTYTTGSDPIDGAWTNSVFAGMKTPIYSGKKGITQIGFIGHIGVQTFDWAFTTESSSSLTPDFRFCVQHSLTDKYALSYNAGCAWDPFTYTPAYIYTLSNAYAFTDRLGAFVEFYGQFSSDEYEAGHLFDSGLTYLIRENMQLDISGGVGMTEWAQDWFLSAGYSLRLPN